MGIDPVVSLPASEFSKVVENTPLVSIDLVISDSSDAIVMGWRNNEPARHTWFVPGGRIRKNEKIATAFSRIMLSEIGLRTSIDEAQFGGVYEHLYTTNCFDVPSFGTHYIVLAYVLRYEHRPNLKTDEQHSRFDWLTSSTAGIHPYSQVYFKLLQKAR